MNVDLSTSTCRPSGSRCARRRRAMRRGCWCSTATATRDRQRRRPAGRSFAAGDLLVFNDTRVIPAQLEGRAGDARIGATLHKREGPRRWRAFIRNAKRLRDGDTIDFGAGVTATASDRARTAAGVPKSHLLGDEPGRLARGKISTSHGSRAERRQPRPPPPLSRRQNKSNVSKRAARPRRDEMSHTLPRKFTNTLVSFRGAAPPQHVVSCYAHRRSVPSAFWERAHTFRTNGHQRT